MKQFVYVQGLRGPEPQIWKEPQKDGTGKSKPVLQKHDILDSQAEFSIATLMEMYPYVEPT